MVKKLEDFTVRVNCDGWHVRGFGSCWTGQEFHGSEILPRMVKALEEPTDKFKFQGQMVDVCVLRGGSVEELKAAIEAEKGSEPVKVAAPPPPPPPAPKPEPVPEPEPEPEPEEDEDDDDDDDEDEDKPKKKKKVRRSPRAKS